MTSAITGSWWFWWSLLVLAAVATWQLLNIASDVQRIARKVDSIDNTLNELENSMQALQNDLSPAATLWAEQEEHRREVQGIVAFASALKDVLDKDAPDSPGASEGKQSHGRTTTS